MSDTSCDRQLRISGMFDPDFDPNQLALGGRDLTRDDTFEMIDVVSFYRIMGYTDGYTGNPSRQGSFSLPYADYYQSGYNDGNWTRLVDTQN